MAGPVLITFHVAAGITAVACGAAAMLAPKRPGSHPRRGLAYLAALTAAVATGATIAATDWPRLWHLAGLGAAAALLASAGYAARRRGWICLHITAMSGSYIAILTAFYVDNGPHLPLWNQLPPTTLWVLPAAVGAPLLAWTLYRHRDPPGRPHDSPRYDQQHHPAP